MNPQQAAAQEALRHLDGAARSGGAGAEGRQLPRVEAKDRPMRDVAADAIDALKQANDPENLFVRSGALASVRRDEEARPLIVQLDENQLRGRLARAASFVGKKGEDVSPPLEIVRDVLSIGEWPFPPLMGITEAPTLRPDGTLLMEPGYDPGSRLVYAPQPGLQVPPIAGDPTEKQRQGALSLLGEAFEGFPFADEAGRANALALALTLVMRPAIGGLVPLALLDATKAGSGKGLLAKLVATIATGKPGAMRSDEAERR